MHRLIEHSKPWLRVQQAMQAGRLAHALLVVGDDTHAHKLLFDKIAAHYLQVDNIHHHPDVYDYFFDHALISVDDIRDMNHWVMQTSDHGVGKVVMIRVADAMNSAAMNALLKTLEEPPLHVLFLLESRRPELLLATIKSRCQIIPGFAREPDVAMATSLIASVLNEFIEHRLTPVACARLLSDKKIEISDVLLTLQWMVGDFIRMNTGLLALYFKGSAYQNYAARMSNHAWYALLDCITAAYDCVLHQANLNVELMLDDIFIKWNKWVMAYVN